MKNYSFSIVKQLIEPHASCSAIWSVSSIDKVLIFYSASKWARRMAFDDLVNIDNQLLLEKCADVGERFDECQIEMENQYNYSTSKWLSREGEALENIDWMARYQ